MAQQDILRQIRTELISLKVDIRHPEAYKIDVDGRLDEILKIVRRAIKNDNLKRNRTTG